MLKILRFADLRKISAGYVSADNLESAIFHFVFPI